MHAVINMGKGLLVPQKEGALDGSRTEKFHPGVSQESAIDSLGNQAGRSKWEEFWGHGGCSQEMQNYNSTVHDFNRPGQFGTIAGFCNASSAYRNGGVDHTAEACTQPLSSDMFWNSSWSQLLALMESPSAVSEIGIANKVITSTNKHFTQNSFLKDGTNWMSSMMNTPPVVSENRVTNRSVNAAYKHAIVNARSEDDVNSKPSNIANSTLLYQNCYLTTNQQRSCNHLPRTFQDGFPVPLQHQYSLNSPLRSEADTGSSTAYSSQFAPVTPEQAKKIVMNGSVDQDLSKGKVEWKSLVAFTDNEAADLHCHGLAQSMVDTTSAANCTPFKKSNDSDRGDNQDFNQNNTPQQKTPKRKKHRPKVVAERKPRKNRKPVNPNQHDPKGDKMVKRKYVRKNVPRTTKAPEAEAAKATRDFSSEPASRSCRKALNFEMENKTRDETWGKLVDQQETHDRIRGNLFVNANSLEMGMDSGSHNVAMASAPKNGHWNKVKIGNKEAGLTCSIHQTVDQQWGKDICFSNGHTPTTQSLLRELQKEKPCFTTCNIIHGPIHRCQSTQYCNIGGHQHVHAGVRRSFLNEGITQEQLERTMQSTSHRPQQKVSDSSEGRGSKREYSVTAKHGHPNSGHLMSPSLLCQENIRMYGHQNRNNLEQSYSGIHKRKKVDNGSQTTTSSIQNQVRFVEDDSRQVQTNNGYHINVNQFDKGNSESLNSKNNSKKLIGGLNNMIDEENGHFALAHINILKKHMQSEVCPLLEETVEKKTHISNPSRMISSMTAKADCDMQPRAPYIKSTACTDGQGTEALNEISHAILSTKKKGAPTAPKFPSQRTGSQEKQKNLVSINDIIWRFQHLNLNATSGEMVKHEQNAIVLYEGDRTIVPYEALDPIKRRNTRPKVDLDPETNRIWKLLMGKEVSDDDKDMDAAKAKWWEEERKVFYGRADSFIARMHLVQGDRRFSQWKGSVVDSVIGVFLTQNVTDHLSSSAFMCLAARFPIQSISKNITCQNNVPGIFAEEPEVFILDTDNNIRWPKKSSPKFYGRTADESSDYIRYNPSMAYQTLSLVEENNWGMEEMISTTYSTESSTVQSAGGIKSCSISSPRTYCATSDPESLKAYSSTSFIPQQMENMTRFLDSAHQVPGSSSFDESLRNRYVQFKSVGNSMHKQLGSSNNLNNSASVTYPFDINKSHMQVPAVHCNGQFPVTIDSELFEVQSSRMFGKKSTAFFSSSASGISRAQHVGLTSWNNGQVAQRKNTLQQNQGAWPQGTPTAALHNKHPTHQKNHTQAGFQDAQYQYFHSNPPHGRTASFQLESRSDTKTLHSQIHEIQSTPSDSNIGGPKHNTEERISVAGKEAPTENKTTESSSKEHNYSSSEAYSRMNINTFGAKGEKIEGEKKMTCDWDGLRKQVQSDGRRRERTKDTMDSIDYEAVRCADISEISNAIKHRGMNNMLAERIKDFLNRLVRDHGSIDLEWLRDVPPEKAKDYLLSIWGLGLKSVECVRLLTLHQHAFPVDTNVGRIAVRLGWVPLQPLPESLQLHLLELYPVLESIQKYLWPRLCKLDQRTLYELHYQLITFGKVFCTKSKPNCNACPMRGECRHFASAFASARLALPSPEEKSIVTSAIPVQDRRKPAICINPTRPPSLEDMPLEEAALESRRCEPIVEEPTTPELESTEISETDIEDAFYEDPDEIPIIKLNAEEITLSLQNYIQGNMDLQEWDMSKALIAINPEAASITTPKLKKISRLRTEHQVYELPDSHPLLKELDKREPDDPSLYLLAIWTPGETANSIQQTEGICRSWESGKLCSEKTCLSCNSQRESSSQIVRGTLLIPCRTAMKGSFPLNGTYFQVNEVFADHDSSLNPIDVPRECLWNLPRRTVYFGSSVSTIFKGMSTMDIQQCFWRGFVCVRGFDRKTRAPRPLMARLHFPARFLKRRAGVGGQFWDTPKPYARNKGFDFRRKKGQLLISLAAVATA
ncbi:hypothetical protein Nepgr_002395 [Nepenthes gracilis]|uniref:HhH-GPD domain-containing protein n=1 Tax=Nepenthes gracilis TaxID=150966 RepID=A0AAD3P6R3_NEPGR|nr:hypothetical protein Nepgr_002395 [Nepenthes gracilis]